MFGYNNWVHHGEDKLEKDDCIDDLQDEGSQSEDDYRMPEMVNDIFRDQGKIVEVHVRCQSIYISWI